jgi:signal transduction histidine kinase
MAVNEPDDTGVSLADLEPTTRQTWWAVAVATAAVVAFVAVTPFAGIPLVQLNALFPSLDAIVFVSDLVTAVLLFAQFSITRSRALLALTCGYLFTALIVIPHALTFAGAFSPRGLLGAGLQTGSWLFIFWHIGFAAALLAYGVLKRHDRPISESSVPNVIVGSIIVMAALVCGITWLTTGGEALLPPIILDESRMSSFVIYPVWFTILLSAAAIGVLATSRRSVLDQWLMVVAVVFIGELAFSGLLPSIRFSAGFYAGRAFSLVTSSVVLIALLAETMRLYVRLARSNAMLERERNNKLMNMQALASSISHELRQPLSAIMLNSETALLSISRQPPNLATAASALNSVISHGERTTQMLESVRALFGKDTGQRDVIDVNEVVRGVLRILRDELTYHSVAVRLHLALDLPLVAASSPQLQEVFVNVIQNAIEAMTASNDDRRVLTVRTWCDAAKVLAEIEDSGSGIDPDSAERMFDAFVTTKSTGMGLGLAICRMIIERHGGRISVGTPNPPGATFRIELPGNPLH